MRSSSPLLRALAVALACAAALAGVAAHEADATTGTPVRAAAATRVGAPATTARLAVARGAALGLARRRALGHAVAWTGSVGDRPVLVVAPPTAPTAVVLALHGYHGSPQLLAQVSGLPAVAAARGWLLVAPSGTDTSWDAGTCCGTARAHRVDDVAYLSALLRTVRAQWQVGPAVPVVGVGLSNGAMMVSELACRRPGLLAGALLVAGGLQDPTCDALAVPDVVQVRSLRDRVVPVDGGPSRYVDADFLPDSRTAEAFAAGRLCDEADAALATAGGPVALQTTTCGGDVLRRLVETGGAHRWDPTAATGGVSDTDQVVQLVARVTHPRFAAPRG